MKFRFTLLTLLLAGTVYAQEPATTQTPTPTIEELSARIEALTAQVDSLSAQTREMRGQTAQLRCETDTIRTNGTRWERFLAAMPKISGYLQTGYEWSETSSTFFIKRAGVVISGDIVPKLDYCLHFDVASPKVNDAFLRYRPFDEFGVQIGAFKIPFSIENTDYLPLSYEFIEYPLVLRRLMGFDDLCGLVAGGREIGVQAFGGFFARDGYHVLNYNLGVFNGEGLHLRDNNKTKDISARIMVKPVQGLKIAASYYWGEYGVDYLKRVRYGAGACYDYRRVVLRAEYIYGATGGVDSDGWYAVGGFRATKTLMPIVRYDTFIADRSISQTRQTNYTAGLLWEPIKYLRVQANYTYEHFAASDLARRNVVVLMVTGMF